MQGCRKGSEEMGGRWKDWSWKNQRTFLVSLPHPNPEIAEVGMFIEWKELEGVIVNRVYFLSEVRAKVTF